LINKHNFEVKKAVDILKENMMYTPQASTFQVRDNGVNGIRYGKYLKII
jgi:hypothetical protein